EVVRGPMGVIYGYGAFFGAINIITHETETASKDEPNRVDNVVAAGYGTQNTKMISGRLTQGTDKRNVVIHAGTYYTAGLNHPYSDYTVANYQSQVLGFGVDNGARTSHQLFKNKKYFGVSGLWDKFYLESSYDVTEQGVLDGFPNPGEGEPAQIRDFKLYG